MDKAGLRLLAYENGRRCDKSREKRYLNAAAYFMTGGERFHNVRRAKVEAYILDNLTLEINESELLAGRMANGFEFSEEKAALVDKYKEHKKYAGALDGRETAATGHRVIDYEKLLNEGAEAVLSKVRAKRAALSYSVPETAGERAFYDSVIISLEALLRFAARWREAILAAAGREEDTVRRTELLRMAENLEKAPAKPCTHFYEALQCMWLVQFALFAIDDISLTGRLDNYLWPFYRADVESGHMTREFAFELIEHLYYKHNEIYNDWPASVMVGGRDRDGKPVVNELTYMCIEAIGTTGLVNPSVALCYTPETPDDLLQKSMEMVSRGLTRPSIFNDDLITRGLINAGVDKRDAHYYCHSTCVEITPIASSNILVATPYVNSARVLEHILSDRKKPYRVGNISSVWVGGGGMDKENVFLWDVDFKLAELDSFEKFFGVCREVLASLIGAHAAAVCDFTEHRARYQSCPLASAFLDDCIKRGKDAGAGGAKYNFIYPTFPGIINLIDSIAAVKKTVYDEKLLTLGELAKVCAENYDGNEPLRRYLTDRCPKFGNDDDAVDSIGKEIYYLISSELSKYKTSIGGTAHPSYFAYILHGMMGEVSDATPDGRKKGEALSEHLGAVQGMDRAGPTAVMRSVCKLDQSLGIGGIATNYRFSCAMMEKEKGRRAVADLTRVFMKNGGFEVQFNVVNADTLKDAREHPENYRTLLVRVAGYSDYFVNLKPVIQDEIIKRTEHGEI